MLGRTLGSILVAVVLFPGLLVAAECNGFSAIDVRDPSRDLPVEFRLWYRNIGYQGGSCVQESIGMAGAVQNCPAAEFLSFDSEYGPAILGPSGPQRVIAYADQRDIPIWSITGSGTDEWMKWACRNGRDAAIGFGVKHFQTLVDHDVNRGRWYVCNNNSPQQVDEYDDREFEAGHNASGRWVVIIRGPSPPADPQFIPWWEQ